MSDTEERLEKYHSRLDDHEEALDTARERLDRLGDADDAEPQSDRTKRRALAGSSAVAALGVAGAGTASVEPAGQVGTEDRPTETVYAAALAGPLTDGAKLDSIVGDGLTVGDGTLTLGGD